MGGVGHSAMVLAAGFGKRMLPLTLATPKPLIKVAGKPLIDYAFDRLRADHVARAVVNMHHLAAQIEDWARRVPAPPITLSDERNVILDTGGGIVRALPLLGDDPFFVLNADSFWLDEGPPALARLRAAWRDEDMDSLLLLCDPARTTGYDGLGDFYLNADGRLQRGRGSGAMAFIGGYLVHPRLFADAPHGAFSMNLLWDRAMASGRLFGLAHAGKWLHVGTPDAIGLAEAQLRG